MFQNFNQFLALATLLSVGIAGFAVPVRRDLNVVAIVNLDTDDGSSSCLDASNNADGTDVFFLTCEGNLGQAWVIYDGNSTIIQNLESGLCLTTSIGNNVIQLEPCGEFQDPNQEWTIDAQTGQISNGDDTVCMENSNEFDQPAFCEPGNTTQKIITMDPLSFQK